jgi:hypothetical protein
MHYTSSDRKYFTLALIIHDFDVPGDVFQGISNIKDAKATFRNLETVGANLLIGGGKPFTIIFDGVGQIRKE